MDKEKQGKKTKVECVRVAKIKRKNNQVRKHKEEQ